MSYLQSKYSLKIKIPGVIEIFLAVGYGVKYASYMITLRIEGFEVGDHFSGTRIDSQAYFIRTIQTNSINSMNSINSIN